MFMDIQGPIVTFRSQLSISLLTWTPSLKIWLTKDHKFLLPASCLSFLGFYIYQILDLTSKQSHSYKSFLIKKADTILHCRVDPVWTSQTILKLHPIQILHYALSKFCVLSATWGCGKDKYIWHVFKMLQMS